MTKKKNAIRKRKSQIERSRKRKANQVPRTVQLIN